MGKSIRTTSLLITIMEGLIGLEISVKRSAPFPGRCTLESLSFRKMWSKTKITFDNYVFLLIKCSGFARTTRYCSHWKNINDRGWYTLLVLEIKPKETDFRIEQRTVHSNLSRRISGIAPTWTADMIDSLKKLTSEQKRGKLNSMKKYEFQHVFQQWNLVSLPNLADYKLLAPGDLSTPPDEDYMDPLGMFLSKQTEMFWKVLNKSLTCSFRPSKC